jgi:hypothetical protein
MQQEIDQGGLLHATPKKDGDRHITCLLGSVGSICGLGLILRDSDCASFPLPNQNPSVQSLPHLVLALCNPTKAFPMIQSDYVNISAFFDNNLVVNTPIPPSLSHIAWEEDEKNLKQ